MRKIQNRLNKLDQNSIGQPFLSYLCKNTALRIKPNEDLVKLINEIGLYVENFVQHLSKGRGMLWFGQQSTMKSILALYVANALMETQFKVHHEFSLNFLNSFENQEMLKSNNFHPEAENAHLLIVDDCEEEWCSLSESKRNILNCILTIRAYKRLPTIFITPFSKSDLHHLVVDKNANNLFDQSYISLNFDWEQSYILTEKTSC